MPEHLGKMYTVASSTHKIWSPSKFIVGMQFYSIEGGPKTVTFAHGPSPGLVTDSPTECLIELRVTTLTTPWPAAQMDKHGTSSRRGLAVTPSL